MSSVAIAAADAGDQRRSNVPQLSTHDLKAMLRKMLLVRRFEDGFVRAAARRRGSVPSGAVTVVTGEMFAPRLNSLLVHGGFDPATIRVAAVRNDFFGPAIGVAGLLTGRDIQRHLATQADLGRAVLVPAAALRDVDGVFLDDLTPDDLARDLGVPVKVVASTPGALLKAIRDA